MKDETDVAYGGFADDVDLASNEWRRMVLLPALRPPRLAIIIDLDHLRQRMTQFVTEVSPDDLTAYTIPFETYLQWEMRQREEDE